MICLHMTCNQSCLCCRLQKVSSAAAQVAALQVISFAICLYELPYCCWYAGDTQLHGVHGQTGYTCPFSELKTIHVLLGTIAQPVTIQGRLFHCTLLCRQLRQR